MKYIRSLAIALCLTLLLPLAACDEMVGDTDTAATEDATVTAPADTPADTSADASADTPPETEAPVPPPPLPTLADLQAGYTYDWDPNGYTMEFEEGRGQFRVQEVHEIWAGHLMKYRDIMHEHEAFGDYVLYQPDSGPAALPELSAATDPALFAAGNTYELTFTTLTYSTEMRLCLVAFHSKGRRIVEEIEIGRGTTPVTVTYTVAEGETGIGLDWMTDWEPLYIGNMQVKLTLPEDSGQ
jgi:hypothetical protein